jgi:hypothetical protein
MKHKLSAAIALFAGLLGGVLTRYIAPPTAFAQDQPPIPKEVRAQSFTLVDPSDRTIGTFAAEPTSGTPSSIIMHRLPNNQFAPEAIPAMRIVLRDSNGREIWSAGGSVVRPAWIGNSK